jgi:hypothetical protein
MEAMGKPRPTRYEKLATEHAVVLEELHRLQQGDGHQQLADIADALGGLPTPKAKRRIRSGRSCHQRREFHLKPAV